MAKKKRSRGKKSFTLPIAIIGGVLPGVVDVVNNSMANGITYSQKGSPDNGIAVLLRNYIGIQTPETRAKYGTGAWSPTFMYAGMWPLLGGSLVHYIAGKFGINRMLAKAHVPILRI